MRRQPRTEPSSEAYAWFPIRRQSSRNHSILQACRRDTKFSIAELSTDGSERRNACPLIVSPVEMAGDFEGLHDEQSDQDNPHTSDKDIKGRQTTPGAQVWAKAVHRERHCDEYEAKFSRAACHIGEPEFAYNTCRQKRVDGKEQIGRDAKKCDIKPNKGTQS